MAKTKTYLPILDISTHFLSINGQTLVNPTKSEDTHFLRLGRMESNCPSHENRCCIQEGKCSCRNHNRFKPAKVQIRVECSPSQLQPIMQFASDMHLHGQNEISDAILDCIDSQIRIDWRNRAFTFAYPVLDTQWNHGMGQKTMIRRNKIPNERVSIEDCKLEEQMAQLRIKRENIERTQEQMKLLTARNEVFLSDYYSFREGQENTGDDDLDTAYGPGIIVLSTPLLFTKSQESVQRDSAKNTLERKKIDNDGLRQFKEERLISSRTSTPSHTAESRKTTPMIVSQPLIPVLSRAETPIEKKLVKPPTIYFGIQTLQRKIPTKYTSILKPLKSNNPTFKKPNITKHAFEGLRPLFPSQNQFKISKPRL
jgi:hypothetical protein